MRLKNLRIALKIQNSCGEIYNPHVYLLTTVCKYTEKWQYIAASQY